MLHSHTRSLLLAVTCWALWGCATGAKYTDALNSWKGHSDADLINSWGKPADTFNSNGHAFMVYRFSRTKPLSPMVDRTGSPANYVSELFCTTIFDVSSGRIIDWAIKGNDCRDIVRPNVWKDPSE
jgi:hypothetical protein